MAPYMEPKAVERAFPVLVRSRLVRRSFGLSGPSRLRRALILRFIGWFYRRFNLTGDKPGAVLSPDVRVAQTRAMFDSAGTFRGPEGFEAMLEELREAFEEIRFVPVAALELSPLRFFVTIRFEATGRGSGVPTERPIAHIIELDEDILVRDFQIFWDEAEARRAAGLPALG
jgi:ketosteroid isomerase-like protein